MQTERYRYALSITSQFPFCSIPFRLDTYSTCQFNCQYCFASARGGAFGDNRIQVADPLAFEKLLFRNFENPKPSSAIGEMLARGVPIHFGGMSDPFMPLEESKSVTLALLRTLTAYRYPTVISTKSDLLLTSPYLDVLASGRFLVQVSLSTIDDDLGSAVDAGAPAPSIRVRVLQTLSRLGVPTACRLQPLLPGREKDAIRLLEACALAGVRHISVEHLKLPVESKWPNRKRLDQALRMDVAAHFRKRGATRVGREWILPVTERLPRIIELRKCAHQLGLTFGAADNDLLHLSDGDSCCSGVDLVGFDNFMRFNYSTAIKAARNDGAVTFSSIAHHWRPVRSIAMYLNSRSRIGEPSVEGHIRANWNGRANGNSPNAFYGVTGTGVQDANGFEIYELHRETRAIMN